MAEPIRRWTFRRKTAPMHGTDCDSGRSIGAVFLLWNPWTLMLRIAFYEKNENRFLTPAPSDPAARSSYHTISGTDPHEPGGD